MSLLSPTTASTCQSDDQTAVLQIVQSNDLINEAWLTRSSLEPQLLHNADGLWVLSVHRQGEYGKFRVPYIGAEILLADQQLGLVAVLVSYHGSAAQKYGSLGYKTQKGQFYRHYQRQAEGSWKQVPWRTLNDDLRLLITLAVRSSGPTWARSPGKLQSEHKPKTPPTAMTSYKVVRIINGHYFSLYDPTVEYILGSRIKQRAKPTHAGGFYSFPTSETGTTFLERCCETFLFGGVAPSHLALLECQIGGRIINYGHKFASTYLTPVRVLEVRPVAPTRS